MKLLRTVVLGLGAAGLALGVATSAKASDPSWNGFYVGGTAGVVTEQSAYTIPGVVTTPYKLDDGAIYGGTVGFGFQRGPWVYGIEGDWSKADLDVGPIPACGGNCRTSAEWLATLRARVGFLIFPSTLLYATGGGAWAEITNTVLGVNQTETAAGWTWGGGLEVKLNKNWSVKGEYLRVELDDTLACSAATCGLVNFSVNRLDVLRTGVNFKF